MILDVSMLSETAKEEIAECVKRDNLAIVNNHLEQVKVRKTFYTQYGKRIFDILFSLIGLIISAPLNLMIAVVTLFDVGRPIIFKQKRTGKDRKPFVIYKFRNMTNETDINGELLPPSERVTKWGKFVRKTSMDELLNFVSVLNGSMSIVGPRPVLDKYVDRLNERHKCMYVVKPGLECPTLHKLDHAMEWGERLDNNIWYVENCSLKVDLMLIFRIVQTVFDKKSTDKRANANQGGFMGYNADGSVIDSKHVPECYVIEYCEKHGFRDLEEAVIAREHVAA